MITLAKTAIQPSQVYALLVTQQISPHLSCLKKADASKYVEQAFTNMEIFVQSVIPHAALVIRLRSFVPHVPGPRHISISSTSAVCQIATRDTLGMMWTKSARSVKHPA